jgi:rubrerythrin
MTTFQSVNEILDFAIAAEQDAVEFYNELSHNAKTEDMKTVFSEFAQEEMHHKAKLLEIKETGIFEKSSTAVRDLKIADYTVDVQATPDISYQDALILVMKKEKAAFKLYSTLSERAESSELKETFLMLAMEESKHKLRFELEYDEYVLREN